MILNEKRPLVSVIVPTYKSVSTIELCIRSVLSNSYKNVELIIIDSLSNDGTKEIIDKFSDISLFVKKTSRTEARNIGIDIAKGEYILNIDSDMELSENLIEECVKKCEEGFDALIIPEKNVADKYWAKCTNFGKLLSMNEPDYEYSRFVRSHLLRKIKGYDESLVAGEDADVHLKLINLNAKISRTDSIILHHVENLSFYAIVKKSKYYAKTMNSFHDKNMQHLVKRKSLPKVIFEKKKLFVTNPIYGMGWLILTAIIFLYTFRYNTNYYVSKFLKI